MAKVLELPLQHQSCYVAQITQDYLQGFEPTNFGRAETSVLWFSCLDIHLLLRNPQTKRPLASPTPLPKSHGRACPHPHPTPDIHMAPDEPAGAQNDRDWHGRCRMQPLSSLHSPPCGPSEPLPVATLLVVILGCSKHGGKGGTSLLPFASISWACLLPALVDLRQGFRDRLPKSLLPPGIMPVLD